MTDFTQIPTVTFCEYNSPYFFDQPFNTLTSVVLILVALFILIQSKTKINKVYSFSLIFIGISSGLYHGTYTRGFQILDLISMFIFASLLLSISLNHFKYRKIQISYKHLLTLILALTTTAMVPIFGIPQILFVVTCLMALIFEDLSIKKHNVVNYKNLYIGIITCLIAAGFWYLDKSGLWCPNYRYILNGHGIFHLLISIGAYQIYKYISITESNIIKIQ